MGHLAILTAPTPGHLNPVQVLAGSLIDRGWRVSVVHLDAARRFMTDPAIGFLPIHDGTRSTLETYLAALVAPSGPARLPRMIRATAAMTDLLLNEAPAILARAGVTAILADAVEPAGPLIAARLDLPYGVAVTGLPLLREADIPPPFVSWRYRRDAWGRFRNRSGYAVADRLLRPVTRTLAARRRAWKILPDERAPEIQVAQCPRGLDFPRRNLPQGFHYGSPWRPGDVQELDLPHDGRPLVFCSLGTLQGSRRDLFAIMTRACAMVGARAVVGHGGGLTAAEEAELPGVPLVRAFWPQTAVLRQCHATVLHGGFNSVLDALAAGVPIVALPIGFEQPATAARLVHIGAGKMLSPGGLSVRALARALREVMTEPSYRAAARSIASEIAGQGGAACAAAAITTALASAAAPRAAATKAPRD